MLGMVVVLLVVLLAAAVVGVVVTSLFWLSLVALGGILLTGAVGVGALGARAAPDDDDAPLATGRSHLRLAGSVRPLDRRAPQGGGDVRRAA